LFSIHAQRFASRYLAYETLSPGFKKWIDNLKVRTTNLTPEAIISRAARVKDAGTSTSSKMEELTALHPLVRQHPETGRKALFTNGAHTVKIDGWNKEESMALLRHLWTHMIKPEYQCRFNWKRAGALAIWDNRLVARGRITCSRTAFNRLCLQGGAPQRGQRLPRTQACDAQGSYRLERDISFVV
jgi:taurine dioxygenase